jgi:hypothetical protein
MLLLYPQTGANTVTYYENLQLTTVKSFITLAPGLFEDADDEIEGGMTNSMSFLALKIKYQDDIKSFMAEKARTFALGSVLYYNSFMIVIYD